MSFWSSLYLWTYTLDLSFSFFQFNMSDHSNTVPLNTVPLVDELLQTNLVGLDFDLGYGDIFWKSSKCLSLITCLLSWGSGLDSSGSRFQYWSSALVACLPSCRTQCRRSETWFVKKCNVSSICSVLSSSKLEALCFFCHFLLFCFPSLPCDRNTSKEAGQIQSQNALTNVLQALLAPCDRKAKFFWWLQDLNTGSHVGSALWLPWPKAVLLTLSAKTRRTAVEHLMKSTYKEQMLSLWREWCIFEDLWRNTSCGDLEASFWDK